MFSKEVGIELGISTISVAISFSGMIILLAIKSITLLVIVILFYILTNLAGGIICSQCPFQGKFCPGVLQLYFMPFLSKTVYKKKEYSKRAIELGAVLVGIFGSIYYIVGFVSLLFLYWNSILVVVVMVLLGLFLTHFFLSFSVLCPNCTSKDSCPMSRVSRKYSS
jgi:hypothetical protein